MYKLAVPKSVIKELENYPLKVHRQIVKKILALQFEPYPPDSKKIGEGRRASSGEYRIYYKVDDGEKLIYVELVGKRNDDELYRRLKRRC